MKTLAASIVGIFAVGLALGSLVSGSNEAELAELESALDSAPLVDCGEGREALLEPVVVDGRTSFKVRCVSTEKEERVERVVVAPRPAPVVTEPAPAPVEASAESKAPSNNAPKRVAAAKPAPAGRTQRAPLG